MFSTWDQAGIGCRISLRTFLKILEQQESIDSGTIEIGETLKIGHFRQAGIDYKDDMRAIDFVKEIADYITDDVDSDGIWNALKHFGIL